MGARRSNWHFTAGFGILPNIETTDDDAISGTQTACSFGYASLSLSSIRKPASTK